MYSIKLTKEVKIKFYQKDYTVSLWSNWWITSIRFSFFTRMKTWWDPCSSLKMWFREAPPEEERNKTESGKRNAKGILHLNIYLLYFTEFWGNMMAWEEWESVGFVFLSLFKPCHIFSVVSCWCFEKLPAQNPLWSSHGRLHMFEMPCAFYDRWWWSTSFFPMKKSFSFAWP